MVSTGPGAREAGMLAAAEVHREGTAGAQGDLGHRGGHTAGGQLQPETLGDGGEHEHGLQFGEGGADAGPLAAAGRYERITVPGSGVPVAAGQEAARIEPARVRPEPWMAVHQVRGNRDHAPGRNRYARDIVAGERVAFDR